MKQLSDARLAEMAQAARMMTAVEAYLEALDENVVSPLFEGNDTPFLWDHYPDNDVRDWSTHAQFFYHTHDDEDLADRTTGPQDEHGHFHTFLRQAAMPEGVEPVGDVSKDRPEGEKAIAHLIGVSMTFDAKPTHLFTVNRWVTGESFYAADDLIPLLDRFRFEKTRNVFTPTATWLQAVYVLYREEIADLLAQRDDILAQAKTEDAHSVYERRDLEVISILEIDLPGRLVLVRDEALRRMQ